MIRDRARRWFQAIACVFLLVPALGANAQTMLYDIAGTGHLEDPNEIGLVGFFFTLQDRVTLTDLGYLDEGFGIYGRIVLWDMDDNNVAQTDAYWWVDPLPTVVPSGGGGQWLFWHVGPVIVEPGNYYLGIYHRSQHNLFRIGETPVVMPGATMGNAMLEHWDLGYSGGYYGPNARFTAVPEPSSVILWLAGGAPLGWLAIRRRRSG